MTSPDAYARDVLRGRIPAGKYHRLACARHQRDRARENTRAFPFYYDQQQAERFFRFARRMRHYKGRQWAGLYFEPTPCQVFRLGSLFGWRHVHTGRRRFTTAFNELPRKQGKTFEAAIVAIYATFFEGEPGAEGYCIATKRQQARRVFDDMSRMVRASGLRSRLTVLRGNIHRDDTACKFEPLGADADSTDGLNPYVIITDEMHAMKLRALLDVMESALGARLNPLHYQITTAGVDPHSPCGQQHDYACNILDRVFEDVATESFFAFIAHADVGDDVFAPTTWKKANPHYGGSVVPDELQKEALKAKHMPGALNEFKQKRLNLWTNAFDPWLSLDGWQAGQSTWSLASLRDQKCWIGIDMSSKVDLTAVTLVFPPTADRRQWRIVAWCLTPEATLETRAHRDRAPYPLWVKDGWLRTNPGNRIDQDVVRDMVHEADEQFDVQQIGIDPWNAGNLVKDLGETDGFRVVEIPQTMPQMSAPCKDFEADVLDGLVDAGDNPLMRWCIANVVVTRDGKDNIYPVKKKSRGRIDPVIGGLMARKLAAMDTGDDVADDPDLFVA